MGSGKTLFMSILCQWFKDRLNVPIYANYPLKNSIPIKSVKDLWAIQSGVVALDEFWIDMESRQSEYNINLSRWINQTRKKNLLVLYTTQAMSQIDKRVRNANHLLIFCEYFNRKEPFFRYSFITGMSGTILKSFAIKQSSAREFFDIYDTFAVVFPLYAQSNPTKRFRPSSDYQKNRRNAGVFSSSSTDG